MIQDAISNLCVHDIVGCLIPDDHSKDANPSTVKHEVRRRGLERMRRKNHCVVTADIPPDYNITAIDERRHAASVPRAGVGIDE